MTPEAPSENLLPAPLARYGRVAGWWTRRADGWEGWRAIRPFEFSICLLNPLSAWSRSFGIRASTARPACRSRAGRATRTSARASSRPRARRSGSSP